jgi:hypothetical protein
MGLLYGRAGRSTAKNGGFRPGQNMLYITQAPGAALVCAAATKSALSCYADQVGVGQGELLAHTSCAPIHAHRTNARDPPSEAPGLPI